MDLKTFKKTKIYISAVEFTGGREQAMEICRWVGAGSAYIPSTNEDPREYIQVPTMFGPRDAKVGQYIVKLEDDQFLVYKDEVLFSEYQAVVDDPADHPLVRHARAELSRFPNEDEDFKESLIAAVKGFTSYRGHSGSSAAIATHMISALLEGRNLMPLTDDPEEWELRSKEQYGMPNDLWQNKRNSRAISEDGGKTYYLADEKHEPIEGAEGEVKVRIYKSEPHDFVPEIDPNDLEDPDGH